MVPIMEGGCLIKNYKGWEQLFDQDLMKIGIVSPFTVDRLQ